ncbi:PKD domain-containing protein [Dyadobacter pollutisoli]|uniref:PKD domain-containing protein n=1 Tax=Dyadobacter pollutisoli TaxID=2910158 RepID=A0A9E8SQ15_9BACT|nr:PKD domain-containing protein [Dyadobacter pollutisoli]WAC12497.1 PKD domain-containing protein [Dyadobacter pollutisoli]
MNRIQHILIFFILVSCSNDEPAPQVSFTASDVAHGSVSFNQNSTNVTSYLWDFGDGYSTDVDNPTHIYIYNGTYVVTLTVKGKGGEATVKQDVIVKSVLGELMFWMSKKGEDVRVAIDEGSFTGNIDWAFDSEPECTSGGAVTYSNLSDGEHTYHAVEEEGGTSKGWSGTVTVIGGKCVKKELVY